MLYKQPTVSVTLNLQLLRDNSFQGNRIGKPGAADFGMMLASNRSLTSLE